MQRKNTVLTIVTLLLATQVTMGGIVVYDNLGPDDTYASGGDWIGNLFNQWVVVAAQFEPSASGNSHPHISVGHSRPDATFSAVEPPRGLCHGLSTSSYDKKYLRL